MSTQLKLEQACRESLLNNKPIFNDTNDFMKKYIKYLKLIRNTKNKSQFFLKLLVFEGYLFDHYPIHFSTIQRKAIDNLYNIHHHLKILCSSTPDNANAFKCNLRRL